LSTSLTTSLVAALPESLEADGTRYRLLLAGLQGLFDRGFHGTSIRDIAERAGVQSATLYGHFASKEELLAELVVLGHTEHHRRLVDALMDAGPDPHAQLRAVVAAHVAAHAEFPMLASVSTAELPRLSPGAAAPAYALREKSRDLLITVIDRGIRQGVFAVDHRELTIYTISTMGVSVAAMFTAEGDHLDVDAVIEGMTALALRMVAAPA
jgi:AcrR family transcriptional regulator